jgi:DNA topoisomerase-1
VTKADGADTGKQRCPQCAAGFLVSRTGRHGAFLGCTAYPACGFTRDLPGGPAR